MKKHTGIDRFYPFWGIILFSIFLFSSCASDKDLAYLHDQIMTLNKRVSKLQEQLGDDSAGGNLNTIRSNQASTRIELDQIKGTVADLSGRVEDNERVIKRAVERDLGDQDTMRATLSDLSQKTKEMEATLKLHHQYLGLEPAKVPASSEPDKNISSPGRAEPPSPPPKTIVADPKMKEATSYETALGYFNEGKYERALEDFKTFLQENPKSDRADNAQFWVGESYMALKQYEQAILAYQEVIKKYPKGNKVPNALLRQAVAFIEIKDLTSAKLLLQKVTKNYPNSNEAKIAAKRLATLK